MRTNVSITFETNLMGKMHYFTVGFSKYAQFHGKFMQFEKFPEISPYQPYCKVSNNR